MTNSLLEKIKDVEKQAAESLTKAETLGQEKFSQVTASEDKVIKEIKEKAAATAEQIVTEEVNRAKAEANQVAQEETESVAAVQKQAATNKKGAEGLLEDLFKENYLN